ncbi:MAG: hypothetical protein JXR56_09310 [Candidatus Cloacimonetes bacterium]|nr:hypothetical protein [Candidatus Cloacimonadota bacterium]
MRFFLAVLLAIILNIGYSVTISKIVFEGNHTVQDKELRAVIKSKVGTEYSSDVINEDVESIVSFYSRKGLYKTRVLQPVITPDGQNRASILFRIENEESIIINHLDFIGNRYFSRTKLLQNLNPPKVIPLTNLTGFSKQITDLYISRNYLFASVSLKEITASDSGYIATFLIDEGKPCRFTDYSFRGNKVTKDKTLLKLSDIPRQPVITPDILEQAAENIRKKDFIASCDIVPIDEKTLLFEVKEDKMTYVSGIAAYDNSENTEKRFSGFLDLKFLNLFGSDRNLHFKWQGLANDYSELELFYEDSGPVSLPVGGNIKLTRIEQDSTYVKSSFFNQLYYYNLRNRYGIEFGITDVNAGARRPVIISPEKQYTAGVLWSYSDIDYNLNPTNGMQLGLNL